MKRAVLYARVSTDAQQKEGTIESQVLELKRQIAAAGDVLVREYGSRPGLETLRRDVRTLCSMQYISSIRIASLGMSPIRRSSSASFSNTASRSSSKARITSTIPKTSSRSPCSAPSRIGAGQNHRAHHAQAAPPAAHGRDEQRHHRGRRSLRPPVPAHRKHNRYPRLQQPELAYYAT
jgi:hypothetical protein